MNVVGLQQIMTMAEAAAGQINALYLHWSAGHYGQFFDDYHIMIDHDGSVLVSDDDLTVLKSHTWHRNSGAVGIALACCAFATTEDFADEPPTDAQIQAMAQVVATLCTGLEIPCDSEHVMTHAEAADLDGYGPATTCERWDMWFFPGVSRGEGGNAIRDLANAWSGEQV